MAEALQALADLSLGEHVSPRGAESEQFGDQDPMLSGKSAMQSIGLWSLATYTAAESPWACAAYPLVKQPIAFIYPMGAYVFTGSSNKDEVWKLLEHLSTPEMNLRWAQTVSRLPAIPANADAWLETFTAQKPDARLHVITDVLTWDKTTTIEPFQYHPLYTEILTKAITPALDPLWLGEKQAKEILPDLQAQIEQLLAEQGA